MNTKKTSPQLKILKEFKFDNTRVFAGISTLGEMVAIRHVCENLGIDRKWQQKKIQNDPYLSSVGGMEKIYAEDGKPYDTYCLPAMDLQVWLWSLKPTPKMNLEVWESYKKGLVKYLLMMLKVSLDKVQELKNDSEYVAEIRNLQKDIDDRDAVIAIKTSELTELKRLRNNVQIELNQLLRSDPAQLRLELN
jgi:hypothetical protein